MKKVYVVTEGCYSDYHIVAVFSTKQKAKEYIAYHGTGYSLEEYDLDKEYERSVSLWDVTFDLSGRYTTSAARTSEPFYEPFANTCIKDRYSSNFIRFYVYADTKERAIKIANEHLGAIKANDYVWKRLNTVIEERKNDGYSFWIARRTPTYNFIEEMFVDLD